MSNEVTKKCLVKALDLCGDTTQGRHIAIKLELKHPITFDELKNRAIELGFDIDELWGKGAK